MGQAVGSALPMLEIFVLNRQQINLPDMKQSKHFWTLPLSGRPTIVIDYYMAAHLCVYNIWYILNPKGRITKQALYVVSYSVSRKRCSCFKTPVKLLYMVNKQCKNRDTFVETNVNWRWEAERLYWKSGLNSFLFMQPLQGVKVRSNWCRSLTGVWIAS